MIPTDWLIENDMEDDLWRRLAEIEREAAKISRYLLSRDRRLAGDTRRNLYHHAENSWLVE